MKFNNVFADLDKKGTEWDDKKKRLTRVLRTWRSSFPDDDGIAYFSIEENPRVYTIKIDLTHKY